MKKNNAVPQRKKIYLGKYIVPGILLLVCTISVLSWHFGREKRDEILIRNLISVLAEDLSKVPDENAAKSLLKAKSIANAFVDPASITMDKYASGSFDQEKLFNHATRYRTMIKNAAVTVTDMVVEIKSENSAYGYFSGSFEGTTKNGFSDRIVKDIEVDFVRIDGKWKIKNLKFSDVLH